MAERNKRHEIMKAAETLFTSRRFHEITLDEVAQAAHVGKGTIYLYFKDKDDLFFQVSTSGFDELCDLLHRQVPGTAPFEEQLRAAGEQIHAFFQRRRQLLRMMQTEESRIAWCKGGMKEHWEEKHLKLVGAVAAIFDRGLAEGKVRTGFEPALLAHIFLGMLRAWAHAPLKAEAKAASLGEVVSLFLQGAQRKDTV